MNLAHSRVFLIRKAKSAKKENIDEIIFYLKPKYSTHNEEPRIFIKGILREQPSFEAITDYLKTFSKYIKEDEIMSLKNKCFLWWMDFNGIESIPKDFSLVDLKTGNIPYVK